MDELLVYLSDNCHDCLFESGQPLNQPAELNHEFVETIHQSEAFLLDQHKQDTNKIKEMVANQPR